jgi:hypothetical protein
VTEDEAKRKWCPMVRNGLEPIGNCADERKPSWSLCIASACMMFRWVAITSQIIDEKETDTSSGYCGLGGKP